MRDNITPGPACDCDAVKEKVCVHTKKIFDSCRDKDCIEDLRFYPCENSKITIQNATSVGNGCATLLYAMVRVDPIAFNRGFYTVSTKYFYRVTLQVFGNTPNPTEAEGLCIFDKRVILYGGCGSTKSFSSDAFMNTGSLPTAVVETLDPMVLDAKLVDVADSYCCDCDICDIPACVCSLLNSNLCPIELEKRVFVTLGQFSLVRLERDAHLLVPVYDYCMPRCECHGGGGGSETACELFSKIDFPVQEFTPYSDNCANTCGNETHCDH